MKGRVLVIAGSDSGGGAGIQADIKTLTALGAYAATAITALTAQDTLGVHEVLPVPAAFIARQINLVLDDIGADAIKTGMLGEAAAIEAIARALGDHPALPLVLDPVMLAKGGATLAGTAAVAAMKRSLIPMAALITPNVPEAEVLAGTRIPDLATMQDVAVSLLTLGASAVLLKGGHLPGGTVVDVLATQEGVEAFSAPRIELQAHAWDRVHAGKRDCGGVGAGDGATRRGRAGASVRTGGDCRRAGIWRGAWAVGPQRHRLPITRVIHGC